MATACSGLAERARLVAHAAVALFIGAWVYAVPAHWVWSSEGWLSARRDTGGPLLGGNGVIDLAGSGVVHAAAGAAALAAAAAVGPRQGRFAGGRGAQPMPAGSMVLVAAGTLMRWCVHSDGRGATAVADCWATSKAHAATHAAAL